VKSINTRAALIFLFPTSSAAIEAQAEDYYVCRSPNGALVMSNQKPPPGGIITKRISFPDAPDNEAPHNEPTNKSQPNVQPEGSPKPSKDKQP
jgi:hypothetical protein